MNSEKKYAIIFASIVLSIAVAFLAIVTGISWDYFVSKLTGEKYYTQEQYDNSKNEAFQEKDELEKRLQDLRNTIEKQNSQITDLQAEVNSYRVSNNDLISQRDEAIKTRDELQGKVDKLLEDASKNSALIDQYVSQIGQLNSKIEDLNNQIKNHDSIVASLNEKISQLEKSIKYYENFVSELEQGDSVVVKFEYNGSVVNVQTIKKGSHVSYEHPQDTLYVIFNYWMVDNQRIELSDYVVQESVTIVANVTLKYDVKFKVDGNENYSAQIVEKGQRVQSLPSTPTKPGYAFDGWTLNGVDVVDPLQYTIDRNVVFEAKFTQVFDVTFKYEDETKSTQKVRIGEFASNVEVENTRYKHFNGWKVGDQIVSVESYSITQNTEFVADITYYFDVKFMIEDHQVGETQLVEKGHFASVEDPGVDNFFYWTIDGEQEVDVSSYAINENVVFKAKLGQWVKLTLSLSDPADMLFGDRSEYDPSYYSFNISELKTGDIFKFSFDGRADLGTGDSWMLNTQDGSGVYGWTWNGSAWVQNSREENDTKNFGETIVLYSTKPFVSQLGIAAPSSFVDSEPFDNMFTVSVSCKQDGVLTIEWSDSAGFYLSKLMISELYVLR